MFAFMFRSQPRRDQLFRQALGRDGRSTKKSIDRNERFRVGFPYGLVFLWAVFAIVVGYALGISPLLDVREVSISGSARVPEIQLLDAVETILAEKRFRIFSQRNYFFLPETTISETLLADYPLLRSVTVNRKFPDRLEVVVSERPSLLLWCSGGPCYAADAAGQAFSNERFLQRAYDPWRLTVTDTSALSVTTGAPLAGAVYLDAMALFSQLLPEQLSLTLRPEASTPSHFSRELRLVTGDGWVLLVSVDIPPKDTVALLQVFLDERSRGKAKDIPLSSIDMRVSGRIFFTEQRADTGVVSPVQEATPPEENVKEKAKKKKETKN